MTNANLPYLNTRASKVALMAGHDATRQRVNDACALPGECWLTWRTEHLGKYVLNTLAVSNF